MLIVRGETEATDIWSHELIVNHITFHVIEAAFEILQEGDVYAIYYAKHLRQIIENLFSNCYRRWREPG